MDIGDTEALVKRDERCMAHDVSGSLSSFADGVEGGEHRDRFYMMLRANRVTPRARGSKVVPGSEKEYPGTALKIGTRLGSYEIVGRLGAGSMGDVYRARDLKLPRDVAIKVIPDELTKDPTRLRRFEQEALTASSLSHPNIVQYLRARRGEMI